MTMLQIFNWLPAEQKIKLQYSVVVFKHLLKCQPITGKQVFHYKFSTTNEDFNLGHQVYA